MVAAAGSGIEAKRKRKADIQEMKATVAEDMKKAFDPQKPCGGQKTDPLGLCNHLRKRF
jgi:hypothetical protein